jgi:hypothetical protein
MNTGYAIEVMQGSSYSLTFNITDSDSNAINISGYTFTGVVKSRHKNTGVLSFFSFQTGSITGGQMIMSLTSAQTAAMPVGRSLYEIEAYPDTGTTQKYLDGYFDVYPELNF